MLEFGTCVIGYTIGAKKILHKPHRIMYLIGQFQICHITLAYLYIVKLQTNIGLLSFSAIKQNLTRAHISCI